MNLIERLDGVKELGGDRWMAKCPAHDDKSPTLSVRLVDDKWLIYCFAGCPAIEVVHALGIDLADLWQNRKYKRSGEKQYLSGKDVINTLERESTFLMVVADALRQGRVLSDTDMKRLCKVRDRIDNLRHCLRIGDVNGKHHRTRNPGTYYQHRTDTPVED